MDKTSNIRAKKVGSNLKEFKADNKEAYDFDTDFSEGLEDTNYLTGNFRKIKDCCYPCWQPHLTENTRLRRKRQL